MKINWIFLALSLFNLQLSFCQMDINNTLDLKPWEDPQVSGINRLPSKATSYSYPNESLALQNDKNNSSRYKLLNGNWKFYWARIPEGVP
ncbi:hypothetical protein, partial [Polaribacter sargassicola]|uniref:hypothetical protein n=1 Tax=Polaribacter sargassicola TaxID=2836891 RepID=UPI001F48EE83